MSPNTGCLDTQLSLASGACTPVEARSEEGPPGKCVAPSCLAAEMPPHVACHPMCSAAYCSIECKEAHIANGHGVLCLGRTRRVKSGAPPAGGAGFGMKRSDSKIRFVAGDVSDTATGSASSGHPKVRAVQVDRVCVVYRCVLVYINLGGNNIYFGRKIRQYTPD